MYDYAGIPKIGYAWISNTILKFPMKFASHTRNSGQIMYLIPELFRALEKNLGLYKHENTLVLFLSIFPERYWNNHPWLSLLHIVIVRLLCFQGTLILYNVLYIVIFSLPLIKSESLNWPWSTKISGQVVTRMHRNWFWYWKVSVSVTTNTSWRHR